MNEKRIALLALLIVLGGCATHSLNRVDSDNEMRQRWLPKAEQGEAEAQYQLGLAYCCGAGYYSTETAVKWWCRAAAQGHEAAKSKLDEHVAADVIEVCRKSLT